MRRFAIGSGRAGCASCGEQIPEGARCIQLDVNRSKPYLCQKCIILLGQQGKHIVVIVILLFQDHLLKENLTLPLLLHLEDFLQLLQKEDTLFPLLYDYNHKLMAL